MLIEMLALQMENRSNQEFAFLCIHPDETTVKAKRVRLVVNGINSQHFKIGPEGFLVGQQQGAYENVVRLEGGVHRHPYPSGTEIHRYR